MSFRNTEIDENYGTKTARIPGTFSALVFNLDMNRWDHWDISSVGMEGTVIGRDGEVYISDSLNLKELFGSTTKKSWAWHSGEITINNQQDLKRFLSVAVKPYVNDAYTPGTVNTSGTNVISVYVNNAYPTLTKYDDLFKLLTRAERKGQSIIVRLDSMDGTVEIESIRIVARVLKP